MATSTQAKPDRQIRIGLVLYGGVSLAIYIYGVVFEFMRAIQASDKRENNAYSEILERTNSHVTVDIITGTSAGGINGVFLAKALCNGSSTDSLERVRNLWLKAADFSSLLRPGRREPAALLDEDYLEKRLLEALAELDEGARSKAAVGALDLFVTTTDLNGRVIAGKELTDSYFNQNIGTREHRKVFHLTYRTKGFNEYSNEPLGYDKNDLSADRNETLARVCRATSAFPVAFRPVRIAKDDDLRKLLPPGDRDPTYLTDGGVLNNKPFTDCIQAIARRAAFGEVDRMMFYVEPGPESFTEVKGEPPEPGFWNVAVKTSVAIPSNQSVTRDMKDVRDRNERITWFKSVLNGAESVIAASRDSQGHPVVDLPENEYRQYLEAQPLFRGYAELKIAGLRTRLRDQNLASGLGLDRLNAESASKVKKAFDAALDRTITAKTLPTFLKAFDAPYRIRRSFRLVEITELAYTHKKLTEDQRKLVDGSLKKLWAILDKAAEIEWRTWDSSDDAVPQGWFWDDLRKLKGELGSTVEHLTDEFTNLLTRMIDGAGGFRGLVEEYDALTAATEDEAKEIDALLAGLPPAGTNSQPIPSLFRMFDQFEFRDMFIYPIELFGNLGERDSIEIVRVSPRDANFISSNIDEKLAGDALFHFGGFLDEAWRKNDIMWGRLDAAELIVKTLCKKALSTEEREREQEKLVDSVLKEILERELPEAVDSPKGYRNYLREDYSVGKQSLGDVDAGKRVNVAVSALQSMRDMARYDEKKTNGFLAAIDRFLEKLFRWIMPIATVFRALVDRDSLMQTVFSALILIVAAWGAITAALFIIGKVWTISWLNFHPGLAGVAAAAVVVAALLALLQSKLRRGGRTVKSNRSGKTASPPPSVG